MGNLIKQCFKWQWLAYITVGLCFTSCKDDENGGNTRDPNKPLTVDTFYPITGGIATPVILKGNNFGSSKEDVRVWFNKKRAPIIGIKDNMIYVYTPKLTYEEEIEVSVAIGNNPKDSVAYKDIFTYVTQTNMRTLVGGDKSSTTMIPLPPSGSDDKTQVSCTLTECQFNNKIESGIATDDYGNLYFYVDKDGAHVFVLNENKNTVTHINKLLGFMTGVSYPYVTLDNKKLIIGFSAYATNWMYHEVDNQYVQISPGDLKFTGKQPGGWKYAFVENPDDHKVYYRTGQGNLVRFDPDTNVGEFVSEKTIASSQGDCQGIAFSPLNHNLLYMSNENKHCIYEYNLETDECRVFAGKEGQGGYREGEGEDALFNRPRQICFDDDGNLYVADCENHCIRMISKEGITATAIGIPKKSGFVDGTKEDALFNKPWGLARDKEGAFYVTDSENRAVRRFAIE